MSGVIELKARMRGPATSDQILGRAGIARGPATSSEILGRSIGLDRFDPRCTTLGGVALGPTRGPAIDAPFVDNAPLAFSKGVGMWIATSGDAALSERFLKIRDRREMTMTEFTRGQLQHFEDLDQLFFREETLSPRRLHAITLPLEPGKIGGTAADSPVIMVVTHSGLLLMNGNHRVFKVLSEGGPTGNLCALVFKSIDVFEHFVQGEIAEHVPICHKRDIRFRDIDK